MDKRPERESAQRTVADFDRAVNKGEGMPSGGSARKSLWDSSEFIGTSAQFNTILETIEAVAARRCSVVITGETGTGKEMVAPQIHKYSDRADKAFIPVDCTTLTGQLFESQLFGHMKGAFTDAYESRAGKFEVADKGSLFLDEIGNISFHLQSKLLAAIQNRQVYRIGSNQPIPVDIRLICATNKNLESMVCEGLFREDLLYRINTIQIEVPPLRERGNDVLVLAGFFLKKYASKYNKPGLEINLQAREKLMKYSWPGNIRELQHTVEKAVILSDNNILKPDDFFMRPVSAVQNITNGITLEEMEKNMIDQAIRNNHGNLSATADQLGITRQTLYNKMKRFRQ